MHDVIFTECDISMISIPPESDIQCILNWSYSILALGLLFVGISVLANYQYRSRAILRIFYNIGCGLVHVSIIIMLAVLVLCAV